MYEAKLDGWASAASKDWISKFLQEDTGSVFGWTEFRSYVIINKIKQGQRLWLRCNTVASDSRRLRFDSILRRNFVHLFTINCIEKTKIKIKEAGFLKPSLYNNWQNFTEPVQRIEQKKDVDSKKETKESVKRVSH